MAWGILAAGVAVISIIAFLLIRNWSQTKQWLIKAYTKSVQVSAQSATRREMEQQQSEVITEARKVDQKAWEEVQQLSDDELLDEISKGVKRK